ncbi:cytochrome c peroxidase [Pseudoxanthomonas wuyuanensis]|uniref:Cytochrome c peroxidase n=2 Tax=Pseudoxanthomonas wuyuanensis TaxID=1073196 RepID=A0A286CWH9_9GAMM|nr:cytochrome c peroxidase [Pseudoxanthomonas wuyuanensis]
MWQARLRRTSSLFLLLMIGGCTAPSGRISETTNAPPADSLLRLGEQIFNDRRFSRGRDVSCSDCHQAVQRFADRRPVSVGTGGAVGTRNAPSLLGVSAHASFFWDGRQSDISLTVLDAFTNPMEMGLPSMSEAISRLKEGNQYTDLICDTDHETVVAAQKALVAFLTSLPPASGSYERYRTTGDQNAMNDTQRAGLALFSTKARCTQCHSLDQGMLTNQSFHHTGVGFSAVEKGVSSILARLESSDMVPLGHVVLRDAEIAQLGRYAVTKDPSDLGSFRTPSLRNVAETAPYMHDGSVETLEEAIDREIYYRGLNENTPISLSVEERKQLTAFLEALSDDN